MWPRLAVGAVVIKDNNILLVKRKYPPSAGWWSIPGGHVEEGELLEDAVIRELHEETGLLGINPKLLALTEYISIRGGTLKYHYVIVDYLISSFKGELRKGDEVLDISFFNLADALYMNITLTTRKLINNILREGLPEGDKIFIIKVVITDANYDEVVRELLNESSKVLGREVRVISL